MNAVEQLPVPYWLTYLVLFLLQVTVSLIVGWLDGSLRPNTLPTALLYPMWLWGPLAIMTYLDAIAREALSDFGPLLDLQAETSARLKYEFTTMPGRSVIISGAMWSIIYVLFVYLGFDLYSSVYRLGAFATAVNIAMGLVSFFIGSTLYYHTMRQLGLVGRTVKLVNRFNLFRLGPVYAFSRLTARTGVAWVFLASFTLLVFPIQLAIGPMLVTLSLQATLAIAAFVLPLWHVHQRLVREKRNLLADLNQRVESTLARLHRCLDADDLGETAQINSALSGLAAERDVLLKIPTWPWRAGTFTGFLSALLLPIALFLIQLAIKNWLGG
jgi:hypothetical protein